jgi:uncharacterized protein (TIGR02594 family)
MFELIKRLLQALFWRAPSAPPVSSELPWMTWALQEVGFHEKPSNRGIEHYIALAHTGSIGDPWCAIFANAALEASGYPGSRSAMARSFERNANFVKLAGPAYGAITTMWRQSPSSGLGHVFYYLGENDNGILALGGNQSDRVCKQYEPRHRIVGYYWPKSAPPPVLGRIAVVDDGAREGSEA